MVDKDIQEQLRAKYNPEGSDLRRAQMIMLDLLKFLDKICKENNLTYWIDSGTLLGAVRHGGFIPWDDDVDVCMPRKDALKLIKIMGDNVFEDHIVLQNQSTDWNWLNCDWCKLRDLKSLQSYDANHIEDNNIDKVLKHRGIQLDIFEMESGVRNTVKKFVNLLYYYLSYRIAMKNDSYILRFIANFNARIFSKAIIPSIRLFNNKTSSITYAIGVPFKNVYSYKSIYPLKRINFEGHSFNCPNDVNEYLENLYGDWEKVPGEDEIITHNSTVRFL